MAFGLAVGSARAASAVTVIDYDGKQCGIQILGYMSMTANTKGASNNRWYVDSGVHLIILDTTTDWKQQTTRYWWIDHSHKNSAYGSIGAYGLHVNCR